MEILRIPNDGWWPKLNDDCTHVVCGSARISCFDLKGNLVFSDKGRMPQWISSTKFLYLTEDTVNSYDLTSGKKEIIFYGLANILSAGGGSWAIWKAQDNSIVKNGKLFTYGYGVSVYGKYLATHHEDTIELFEDDKSYILKVSDAPHIFRVNHKGDVFYGYFGRTWKINREGEEDLTISPWERESVVYDVDDYYWSSTESPEGEMYILGRGKGKTFKIPSKSIVSDVKDHFYIASYDSRGVAYIYFLDKEEDMNPPGITVDYYDPRMSRNWSIRWHDRNNDGFSGSVEFFDGSVHITYSNPKGLDATGRYRPVQFFDKARWMADINALRDLYRREFGRDIDFEGLRDWGALLVEHSRDEVFALITDKKWTGDFLDALHNFKRPTFMLPGMPNIDEVLSEYPGTHVPYGWKTFYPKFPQWTFDYNHKIDKFIDIVELTKAKGKVPVIFIPIEESDDLDAHMRRITPIIQTLNSHVDLYSWGWEINDINAWTANGDKELEYLRRLKDITDKPLYVHFTPERWSGWPSFDGSDDKSELSWLIEAPIQGLLYQEPYDKPVSEIEERAFLYEKKNYKSPGIKGRVETAGKEFIMFEHSRTPDHYRAVVSLCNKYGVGYC